MGFLGDLVAGIIQMGVALIGVVLVIAALFFYTVHADIEDKMEGVCDSGNIFVEIATYEDCDEAQQASNTSRSLAIGCGFFGLIMLYGARHKSKNKGEAKQTETPDENIPLPIIPVPSQGGAPNQNMAPQSQEEKYKMLEKLDSMRDKGIITEEEFQKEKEKILSYAP